MKSLATLTNLYTTLSTNSSGTNATLGIQLMSDQHRYLIQRFFDNESTYTTLTIGAQTLEITAIAQNGDVSATLVAAWPSISCQQLVTFDNGQQRTVFFTQGSTNITWNSSLTADCTTVLLSAVGVQAYKIPANVSKISNDTITVGQLVYTPAPVRSIQEWTMLNALPYTSDIPNYYFIYQNQVMFWPIPSTSGNIITFNYKRRVPNFSTSFIFNNKDGTAWTAGSTAYDYGKGNLSGLAVGSNAVSGTSTSWNTTGKFPLNTDLTPYNLYLVIDPPVGDGIWYPIARFTSDTALLLSSPIQNVFDTATASNAYSIAQLPLLQEDFHDMLVHGGLMTYFSTIKKDSDQFKLFKSMYDERVVQLEAYAGTKSVNVDLGPQLTPNNPNLYLYAPPTS